MCKRYRSAICSATRKSQQRWTPPVIAVFLRTVAAARGRGSLGCRGATTLPPFRRISATGALPLENRIPGRRSIVRSAALCCLPLLVLVGCDDGVTEPESIPSPASIAIVLEHDLLTEGETTTIGFRAFDHQGQPMTPLPSWGAPVWRSAHEEVARVADERLTAIGPGSTAVFVELGPARDSALVRVNPSEVELTVEGGYVIQVIQDPAAPAPLAAGVDGLLRIRVAADRPNFFEPTTAELSIFRNGALVAETTVPARGGPLVGVNQEMVTSWDLPLPGAYIQQGTSVLVRLDPANGWPTTPTSDSWFPTDGAPLPLQVQELAPFRARFLAIGHPGGQGRLEARDLDHFLDKTRRIFPFSDLDVDIREPYFSSIQPASVEDWQTILSELAALRVADGSERHYHGIASWDLSMWGIAEIGGFTAISPDRPPLPNYYGGNQEAAASWIVAHEIGHNFGWGHSNCHTPIGQVGYDRVRDEFVPSTTPEVMSKCPAGVAVVRHWISVPHYRSIFWRERFQVDPVPADEPQQTLLVWGRIGARGITLEPVFRLETRPSLPQRPGPFTLEAFDDTGGPIFSIPFAAGRSASGGTGARAFAFAIPLHMADADRIAALRVVGEGKVSENRIAGHSTSEPFESMAMSGDSALDVRAASHDRAEIRWDANHLPMLMVTEPASGRVLSFARDGYGMVRTNAREVEVHFPGAIVRAPRRVPVRLLP